HQGKMNRLLDSYVQFLRAVNPKNSLSLPIIATYMSITNDKKAIEDCYKELCERTSILDTKMCENVVIGLCNTSDWRRALDVIEKQNGITIVNGNTYLAICKAAFLNGDHHTGWQILQEILKYVTKICLCETVKPLII